jgi:hypothetical protein
LEKKRERGKERTETGQDWRGKERGKDWTGKERGKYYIGKYKERSTKRQKYILERKRNRMRKRWEREGNRKS